MRRLTDEERRKFRRNPMEAQSPMERAGGPPQGDPGPSAGGFGIVPQDDWGSPLPDLPTEERDFIGTIYDICVIADKTTDLFGKHGNRLFRSLRHQGVCSKCHKEVGDYRVCPYCGKKSGEAALEDAVALIKRGAQVTGRFARALWNYAPAREWLNRNLEVLTGVVSGRLAPASLKRYGGLYKEWKRTFGPPVLKKVVDMPDEEAKETIEKAAVASVRWFQERAGLTEEEAMKATDLCMTDYMGELRLGHMLRKWPIDDILAHYKPREPPPDQRDLERRRRFQRYKLS